MKVDDFDPEIASARFRFFDETRGVVLGLDREKAFEKVCRELVEKCLSRRLDSERVAESLKSARAILPEEVRPELRALVDDLVEEARRKIEAGEPPNDWGRHARAIEVVARHAAAEEADEAVARALEHADHRCACACRAHGRIACATCLAVVACPVHDEPDPDSLRPGSFADPAYVARRLHREVGLAVIDGWRAWDTLADEERRAWTEAVRRVVCAPLSGRPRA